MVSWVYFGQKSLMNGFIGNTLMFYFIFVDGKYLVKLGHNNYGIHVILWSKLENL